MPAAADVIQEPRLTRTTLVEVAEAVRLVAALREEYLALLPEVCGPVPAAPCTCCCSTAAVVVVVYCCCCSSSVPAVPCYLLLL